IRAIPGAREAVRSLKARGAKLGVVTSKSRWGTERGLDLCELGQFFKVKVTAEDVDCHKPHPEPVLRALELLDADARATVFIGDSPHDMASGRSAGVFTAAALWGPFERSVLEPHAPSFWLSCPEELARLGLAGQSRTPT
ncbi:MAG: HAD-IA family hydrolase, partial [Acidobacteriota bacterium]